MLRIGLGVVLAALALACAPTDKYVPKAIEEWEGTWVNEHPPVGIPQKTVNSATYFKDYWAISDPDPARAGTHEIFRKWTDPEGNVWYQSYDVVSGHYKSQSLHKVSKSGAALEFVVNKEVGVFSPNQFPTQADLVPASSEYRTYRRAEK